jgi:hypothetical protein
MNNQEIPIQFKRRVNSLFDFAVDLGLIIKPEICERCRKKTDKLVGHHEDYMKPFEVNWFCLLCHRRRHLEMGSFDSVKEKVSIKNRERQKVTRGCK